MLRASFFAATSILNSLPSAVQVFSWLGTVWTGKPVFTAAFHFFCGLHRALCDRRRLRFYAGSVHVTGLLGMPRRVFTYADGLGLDTVNIITTIGAFILGTLLFFVNVFVSLRKGPNAGPNPWDAGTREWATSSPPPPYNFAVIRSIATVCLSGFFYGLIALPWWLVIQRHRGDRQRGLLALAAARDREREEAAHG